MIFQAFPPQKNWLMKNTVGYKCTISPKFLTAIVLLEKNTFFFFRVGRGWPVCIPTTQHKYFWRKTNIAPLERDFWKPMHFPVFNIQFSVKIYHYKVAKMPFGPCLAQNLRAPLCTNSFHIILWYNSQQK